MESLGLIGGPILIAERHRRRYGELCRQAGWRQYLPHRPNPRACQDAHHEHHDDDDQHGPCAPPRSATPCCRKSRHVPPGNAWCRLRLSGLADVSKPWHWKPTKSGVSRPAHRGGRRVDGRAGYPPTLTQRRGSSRLILRPWPSLPASSMSCVRAQPVRRRRAQGRAEAALGQRSMPASARSTTRRRRPSRSTTRRASSTASAATRKATRSAS